MNRINCFEASYKWANLVNYLRPDYMNGYVPHIPLFTIKPGYELAFVDDSKFYCGEELIKAFFPLHILIFAKVILNLIQRLSDKDFYPLKKL